MLRRITSAARRLRVAVYRALAAPPKPVAHPSFPGSNVLPGLNKIKFFQRHDRAPGGLYVVVNDPDFAVEIARRYPGAAVVIRSHPDDVIHQMGITPESWVVRHLHWLTQADNLWLAGGNESGWAEHAAWAYAFGLACLKHGVKGVLWNLQTGHPETEDIPAGRKGLQLICENPGQLALGIHGYFSGLATTGMLVDLRSFPTDRAQWPKVIDLRKWRAYHFARDLDIENYCLDEFGIAPTVFYTEFGCDHHNDIKSWEDEFVDSVHVRRGYHNWKRAFARWFPGWSHARAYVEQKRWCVDEFGVSRRARFATFVENRGAEWDLYATEDDDAYYVEREKWYLEMMEAPPPPPKDAISLEIRAVGIVLLLVVVLGVLLFGGRTEAQEPPVTATATASMTATATETATSTPSQTDTATPTSSPTGPTVEPTPTGEGSVNGVVGFGRAATGAGPDCPHTYEIASLTAVIPALALNQCRTIIITAREPLRLTVPLRITRGDFTLRCNPDFAFIGATVEVAADNYIIDGCVFGAGPDAPNKASADSLFLRGDRGIVQNSTIVFGIDENLAIYGEDITVQNSVIAYGLARAGHPDGEHSKCAFMAYGADRVTLAYNVLAHCQDRNFYVTGGTVEAVSNVIYNPGYSTLLRGRDAHVWACLRGNEYIRGVNSGSDNTTSIRTQQLQAAHPYMVTLYLEDNRTPARQASTRPQTDAVYREEWRGTYVEGIPDWCDTPRLTRAQVLARAGAGDVVGDRAIADVPATGYSGSAGRIIDHPDELG